MSRSFLDLLRRTLFPFLETRFFFLFGTALGIIMGTGNVLGLRNLWPQRKSRELLLLLLVDCIFSGFTFVCFFNFLIKVGLTKLRNHERKIATRLLIVYKLLLLNKTVVIVECDACEITTKKNGCHHQGKRGIELKLSDEFSILTMISFCS